MKRRSEKELCKFINTKNTGNIQPPTLNVTPLNDVRQNPAPETYVVPVDGELLDDLKVGFVSNDLCHKCLGEGQLMICDSCPRTFHEACIDLEQTRNEEQQWFCSYCSGQTHQGCLLCKQAIEFEAVNCSLCHEQMHPQCLPEGPQSWLYTAGGYIFAH